jgi:hypothetical protein
MLLSVFLRIFSTVELEALALTIVLVTISASHLAMSPLNTLTTYVIQGRNFIRKWSFLFSLPLQSNTKTRNFHWICVETVHFISLPQLFSFLVASLGFTATTTVVQQSTKTDISGRNVFVDALDLKALGASSCL